MPTIITRTEYLSFDAAGSYPAVPLNTPGWDCQDYSGLYGNPPTVGEDRIIPGTNGRLAVKRQLDELTVSLPMTIYGEANHEGTAYADARIGMRTNLLFLRTNLLQPITSGNGTRAVTFHLLDGTTDTGSVIVEGDMAVAFAAPTLARAVLRLVIPAGVLT